MIRFYMLLKVAKNMWVNKCLFCEMLHVIKLIFISIACKDSVSDFCIHLHVQNLAFKKICSTNSERLT